jgi:hypothetical protein
MAKLFRLWGKKRGQRLTGWWFIGSVGEAVFFGALFLLGIFALSILIAWQVFSPETHIYGVGFGFWLMVLATASIAGIGGFGFIFRVLQVVTSDEHRSVLASQASAIAPDPRDGRREHPPMVPKLGRLTDSPGVQLNFRLPSKRPETGLLVLGGIFTLAWNGLAAVMLAFAVRGILRGQLEWVLLVLLPIFVGLGVYAARWFLKNLHYATRIGATTVEVDSLPLVSGRSYRLFMVQYGRMSLRKLRIALVCEESATYHQGTDLRVETAEVYRKSISEQTKCRVDFGRPYELDCEVLVPPDVMHSFQSAHNAINWKIVVEGDPIRWPSYSRSFPVVVFPARLSTSERA